MTLKERFIKLFPHQNEEYLDQEEAEMCVKIAEDFAIGFFEWCVSQEALDLINDLVLVGEINKATTSKELLQIYKKHHESN